MKKYIAPIARNINFETESIIAMSNSDKLGNNVDLSNDRESIGGSIWDSED